MAGGERELDQISKAAIVSGNIGSKGKVRNTSFLSPFQTSTRESYWMKNTLEVREKGILENIVTLNKRPEQEKGR